MNDNDTLERSLRESWASEKRLAARIRDLEAAVETGRTALTVSQDRVRELEAALRQSLNPELEPMLWEDYVASVLSTVETKPICSCSTGMPLRRDCQVDHFASETKGDENE